LLFALFIHYKSYIVEVTPEEIIFSQTFPLFSSETMTFNFLSSIETDIQVVSASLYIALVPSISQMF